MGSSVLRVPDAVGAGFQLSGCDDTPEIGSPALHDHFQDIHPLQAGARGAV